MAKVTLPGGVKLCIGGKSTILTDVILGSKLFPFKITSSAKRERFKNRKDTTNDSSFIIIGLNCILRYRIISAFYIPYEVLKGFTYCSTSKKLKQATQSSSIKTLSA